MKLTDHELLRLEEVRLASKRGRSLTPEEMTFCQAMFKKDPRVYRALDEKIRAVVAEDFRF